MCDLLGFVIERQIGPKKDLPAEKFATMRSIWRTIGHEPNGAFDRIVQDLISANKSRAKFQKMVYDLIGKRDFAATVTFPPQPSMMALQNEWKALRDHLKNSINFEGFSTERMSFASSGAHLASRLDDLLQPENQFPELKDASNWVSNLIMPLNDPLTAQNVMSIALGHVIFSGPESMCEEQSWRAAIKIYNTIEGRGNFSPRGDIGNLF